ncbi:26710_t:CDS:1, partial [Racocetra persica]
DTEEYPIFSHASCLITVAYAFILPVLALANPSTTDPVTFSTRISFFMLKSDFKCKPRALIALAKEISLLYFKTIGNSPSITVFETLGV